MQNGSTPQSSSLSEVAKCTCPISKDVMRPWLNLPADWRRPTVARPWQLVWCDSSQFGQVWPRPEPEEVVSFYDVDDYYTHFAGTGASAEKRTFFERLRKHLAWRVDSSIYDAAEAIAAVVKPGATVLDIGCGGGLLLEKLKTRGYAVTGVEPDPVAREVARSRGVEVYAGTAEQTSAELVGRKFDAVSISHVLEHTIDPIRSLTQIFDMLNPGGMVICEVPNNEAQGLRRLGISWLYLDVPRHLNFFTEQSLTLALKAVGFQPWRTDWVGYSRQFERGTTAVERHIFDTFRKQAASAGPMRRHSAAESSLLLVQTAFASNRRKYDSIRIVARKPQ